MSNPGPVGPADLPLHCRCGQVRGIARQISPSAGLRLRCYCTDCQAFARFLGRTDILDAAGGSDIFQMPPGRLDLTAGTDLLRSLRLSDQGVVRWYAGCCRTPIANTAPGLPVVGVICAFMADEEGHAARDDLLGPALCRIYDGSATGPLPADAHPPASWRVFALRVGKLLGWWAHGLTRPNPFFDDQTKAPRAKPQVLTAEERGRL